MRTRLTQQFLDIESGRRADSILRKCVHCGFCNATCPTYQLTGDELDGPRGRIYQIKQVLEGDDATAITLQHLDRCLVCRNCETTCPSGVDYSSLLDIGRPIVEQQAGRSLLQRWQRALLRRFLLSPLFKLSLGAGRALRPLLPGSLKRSVPQRDPLPPVMHDETRKPDVLLVSGCVQEALQPAIDIAARRVLAEAGVATLVDDGGRCCGALSHHLSAETVARQQAKANIDRWTRLMDAHAIATLTMTASGCGVMIRDYPQLLADEPDYADKAERIAAACLDPVEIIARMATRELAQRRARRIAFHPPCTQQHGLKLTDKVEQLLSSLGYELVSFDESQLCCGSAGTYSITQRALSRQLRERKLGHIEAGKPEIIVTANIGCQTHLQAGTDIPVRHWLELLTS